VQLLLEAKRPMIYTGGGVILGDAADKLTQLVHQLGFPVTNTLMGLGAYPATDPQFIGMLGMHGTYEANMAMQHCDVLLAIGARFDDRVIGNPASSARRQDHPHRHRPLLDLQERAVDMPIVGPVGSVLATWRRLLGARARAGPGGPGGMVEADRRVARQVPGLRPHSPLIKPQFVVETLYRSPRATLYVTSDVGQHQMFAAQYYPFDKPRRWINSGGLGTMGFGLPAAMGVQLAFPDATVACVSGEASIQMCIQELATCKQYDLPVKIILLNNGYMGMVRQWQEFFYESRYSHSYIDALPDFVKLSREPTATSACGWNKPGTWRAPCARPSP
jgi:acetolactate synthase-1/2/3 large subunit